MRFLLPILGAAAASLFGAAGALDFPRALKGDGYISVPVDTVDRQLGGLQRRQAIEVVLANKDFFYAMRLSIGTPPQFITVLVDTGSSELWVNPNCNTAPSQAQAVECRSYGAYKPSDSTTPPVGPFGSNTIRYGDSSDPTTQTSVVIRYYRDTIAMGAGVILNQTFGVVTSSEGQSQGILGLAPDLDAGYTKGRPYSLILNTLAEQGIIASRVFSLDLRHADAVSGAMIYGGLDKGKFIGKLERVPLANGDSGEPRLGAELSSVGITLSSQPKFYPLSPGDTNVMLDSGTTLTRLHSTIARPILVDLNAVSDGEGYWLADCTLRDSAGTVDFTFGNKTLHVPLSDFILNLGTAQYCYIGLVITTGQQIVGDSILRAGYFIFDWDNRDVHIAQAANCGSDIVAVSSGSNAVPNVTGLCKADGQAVSTSKTTTTSATRSLPTEAFTTTYTITSCPSFDSSCRTGRVTTETFSPEQTSSGSPSTTQTPAPSQTPSKAPSWVDTRQIAPLLVSLLAVSLYLNT